MFAVAPILILVIAIAFDIFASGCTCLVGVVYPTIRSIIALESPDKNDDTQWLTYWSIYGLLTLFDEFTCVFLSKIPYYFFIKVCFLIWLFNPMTLGAQKIYDAVLKPLMTKYESQITEVSNVFNEIFNNIAGKPTVSVKLEESKS